MLTRINYHESYYFLNTRWEMGNNLDGVYEAPETTSAPGQFAITSIYFYSIENQKYLLIATFVQYLKHWFLCLYVCCRLKETRNNVQTRIWWSQKPKLILTLIKSIIFIACVWDNRVESSLKFKYRINTMFNYICTALFWD